MTINLSALQKQRRDTAANWTAENPTLLAGEIGIESDTGYWKVGDGSTAWTSLAYISGLGAEIPVSRLADGSARQLLQTAANGTDVEWTSNVDIPGTLDVTGAATFDAAVTIQGDLTVNGTTTTIDTQNLIVEDKNVIIGQVTTPTDTTADGGGITLKGTTDKTINWVDATDAWTSSERFSVPTGTAAAPTLTFTGDPNTGIYSPGADQVAISTNGTGRLFVDASGRVGIGTSNSLSYPLTIQSGSGADALMLRGRSSDDKSTILFVNNAAGANQAWIQSDANGINIATGASPTERLRLDSSGRLGLGTSSPANTLAVAASGAAGLGGSIKIWNTSARASGGEFSQIGFGPNGDYTGSVIGAYIRAIDPSGNGNNFCDLAIGVGASGSPSERMRITSAGNVGIGTTSPGSTLDCRGAITVVDATTSSLFVKNNPGDSTGLLLYSDASGLSHINAGYGTLVLRTSGTERARIDSSGRLLVGTSSSSANAAAVLQGFAGSSTGQGILQLQVGKNTAATAVNENLGSLRFANSDGNIGAWISGEADLQWNSGDYPSRLVFSTTADGASSPTERMRITNGGSVYFGVTSDPSGTVGGSAFLVAGSDRKILRLATTTTAAVGLAEFYNANGSVGAIATSGTSTSFNTSSDYRLKENVTAVTDGITRLQQLKPSRFNFIADPAKTVDGFLAHEVQSVVPEAITGEKDAVDDDGNPIYQGIDQSKLVPLLTAALQEAVAKIESLEARLTAAGI